MSDKDEVGYKKEEKTPEIVPEEEPEASEDDNQTRKCEA